MKILEVRLSAQELLCSDCLRLTISLSKSTTHILNRKPLSCYDKGQEVIGMWRRKETLKLLILCKSVARFWGYLCLKFLFDLCETCKRKWIWLSKTKQKNLHSVTLQACLGMYAVLCSVCVDFHFSSHQIVPVWLHCSGLPSVWPWSPSKHAGLAGQGPGGTSQGCTENLAPSPPSPPRRRRWLDGTGRKYVTV